MDRFLSMLHSWPGKVPCRPRKALESIGRYRGEIEMSLWERHGGSRLWTAARLLETEGDLSVVGVDIRQERGPGVLVALPGGPGEPGSLQWLMKGSLLKGARTGAVPGNFTLGVVRNGDTVVVRFAQMIHMDLQRPMQLAYRGRDATRLAEIVQEFIWIRDGVPKTGETTDAEQQAALRFCSRPLDERELDWVSRDVGKLTSPPGDLGTCALTDDRLTHGSGACLTEAGTYFLLDRFRELRPDQTAEDTNSDIENFILCARCIRDLLARDYLISYKPGG